MEVLNQDTEDQSEDNLSLSDNALLSVCEKIVI